MSNNFRTFYLYTVSLITLMMIVGGIVATVYNTTSYFFPDSYVFFEDDEDVESKYITDEDEIYTTMQKNEIKKQNYKNEKIKNVVVSLVIIAVGGIMYKYHWKIIENELEK